MSWIDYKKAVGSFLLMDNLNLYASNDNQMKILLETVNKFIPNIRMEFGVWGLTVNASTIWQFKLDSINST